MIQHIDTRKLRQTVSALLVTAGIPFLAFQSWVRADILVSVLMPLALALGLDRERLHRKRTWFLLLASGVGVFAFLHLLSYAAEFYMKRK